MASARFNRFDLHCQRLRLSALSSGLPLRQDLRADDEDRYAKQQRVLEPRRFELEAKELSNPDVEQFVEPKAEHAEREQRRRPAEDFPWQEAADRLDVLFLELK